MAHSLRIAAHALGYATALLDGAVCGAPEVAAALELTSEWRLAALLPLGVPETPAVPPAVTEMENYTLVG